MYVGPGIASHTAALNRADKAASEATVFTAGTAANNLVSVYCLWNFLCLYSRTTLLET